MKLCCCWAINWWITSVLQRLKSDSLTFHSLKRYYKDLQSVQFVFLQSFLKKRRFVILLFSPRITWAMKLRCCRAMIWWIISVLYRHNFYNLTIHTKILQVFVCNLRSSSYEALIRILLWHDQLGLILSILKCQYLTNPFNIFHIYN